MSHPCDDPTLRCFFRDPELFKVILNYLRTRSLVISGVDVKQLLHEAEYYGISALVKQLTLCADAEDSGCGDVLFYSYLSPPMVPMHEKSSRPKQKPLPPPRPPQPLGAAAHSRNSSLDLRAECKFRESAGLFFANTGWVDPLRVRIVAAHQNCIAVAYPHFVACFKQRENNGFQTGKERSRIVLFNPNASQVLEMLTFLPLT